MSGQAIYDSRAIAAREFKVEAWRGWERTDETQGVIYLRRHLSGRLNDSEPEKWDWV